MLHFQDRQFLGNSVESYFWFLIILLTGLLLDRFISKMLSRQLFRVFKKFSDNNYSTEFVELIRVPLELLVVLLTVYMAFTQLEWPVSWKMRPENKFGVRMVLDRTFSIAFIVAVTWVFLRIVDFIMFILHKRAEASDSKSDDQLVSFFRELVKALLVIFSFFFILGSVFQLNITSLIAGLGIGGLAIALAAQETLANLLGSFIIFLDKPFTAGDLVETGDIKGTVESVGFRSTKIRTLDKSLLTVPNKKLIDGPLNNITLSSFRRVKFKIALPYETKVETMKKIVSEIRQLLLEHPDTNTDLNVAFNEFRDSSLEIQIIYFVMTNDFEFVTKVKEEINYAIMDIVEQNGARFAFPGSTLYIQGSEEKELPLRE